VTPISDHVHDFWKTLDLEQEVHLRIDMMREIGHDAPDGPTRYWDMTGFSNDVAKEILAEHLRFVRALRECAAPFASDPGTVASAAHDVAVEFQRRLNIAATALNSVRDASSSRDVDSEKT